MAASTGNLEALLRGSGFVRHERWRLIFTLNHSLQTLKVGVCNAVPLLRSLLVPTQRVRERLVENKIKKMNVIRERVFSPAPPKRGSRVFRHPHAGFIRPAQVVLSLCRKKLSLQVEKKVPTCVTLFSCQLVPLCCLCGVTCSANGALKA